MGSFSTAGTLNDASCGVAMVGVQEKKRVVCMRQLPIL